MMHAPRALRLLVLPLLLTACRSDGEPQETVEPTRTVPSPLHLSLGTAYEAAALVDLPDVAPEDHESLHNVYALSANIVSGSEPKNEEAFRILHEKGIKTILSVDGKVPDQELAARFGMRYVHVPIQYKGITEEEIARIAKTFRELEGPFYVHCFHGQHRGPAAAEIGRLVLDGVPREEALAEMRQWCGTSGSYEGLYATVAAADIPDERATRALQWDFPAANPLEGVAGAMVQISRAGDHLKAANKNAWQFDPGHPDLNALNEATKLASLFERTAALPDLAARPDDFRGWMQDSVVQSAALRDVLIAVDRGGATLEEATDAYQALAATCKACHNAYRN